MYKIILRLEDVPQPGLSRLRPDDGTGRRFNQLGADTKLFTAAQQRSSQDHIDISFSGNPFQIQRLIGEA